MKIFCRFEQVRVKTRFGWSKTISLGLFHRFKQEGELTLDLIFSIICIENENYKVCILFAWFLIAGVLLITVTGTTAEQLITMCIQCLFESLLRNCLLCVDSCWFASGNYSRLNIFVFAFSLNHSQILQPWVYIKKSNLWTFSEELGSAWRPKPW